MSEDWCDLCEGGKRLDEAEARIKKLERRNKALSEALDAALYERSVEVRRVDAAQARLRAADDLANALADYEPWSGVAELLTAYREAGK